MTTTPVNVNNAIPPAYSPPAFSSPTYAKLIQDIWDATLAQYFPYTPSRSSLQANQQPEMSPFTTHTHNQITEIHNLAEQALTEIDALDEQDSGMQSAATTAPSSPQVEEPKRVRYAIDLVLEKFAGLKLEPREVDTPQSTEISARMKTFTAYQQRIENLKKEAQNCAPDTPIGSPSRNWRALSSSAVDDVRKKLSFDKRV